MEFEEYMQELRVAAQVMDDRAREEQLMQFKRAAADWPRRLRLVASLPAQIIPLKRGA